jgi:ABC-type glycerol-3-phosphate transport system substrate-binding protein
MNRRVFSFSLAVILLIVSAACGTETSAMQGVSDTEIITTDPVAQDKTMITVRVEFGAGQQQNLEDVLEYKFPDVDIVLQHDGSTDSTYTVRANLEAGVECDLILSRRLPMVDDIASDYLLDLSAEDFVDSYYMTAVDSCENSDGQLYYLPGPSDVYGIVYNKTMFEENGWQVPHSYSEFVELVNTIKETGIDPFSVSLMYPDMFQILFNTYGYEDVYAGNDNFNWLTSYQEGNGSMVGHMESAVADFKKLFDDGILSLSDLKVTPSERSRSMYVDNSTAMIIECQNAISYRRNLLESEGISDSGDEIAMMPFWTSDEADGDFLYAIPSYYMAINKASAEESDEKKQLLLEIYSYLSSEEGQEMLIGDDFQMSNIQGVELNKNDFYENILSTINRGQVINTFYLQAGETNKQVERQMLSTVSDLIDGTMSEKEWLLAADAVRDSLASESIENEETSYGQVDTTLSRLETAYTIADMYRSLTGADIGICRGGGWARSTNGYLYGGSITDSSLACITPDKEPIENDTDGKNKIVTTSLSGEKIVSILNSLNELSDTKGFYTYFVASGLTVEFDPWAEEGSRVLSCKLPDGEDIDPDAYYEVAYFNGSLPGVTEEPDQIIDMTWKEAFIKWLDENNDKIEKPDMTLTLIYE